MVMSLYTEWQGYFEKKKPEEIKEILEAYYELEKNAYAKILEEKNTCVTGTVSELAARFNMKPFEFVGFVDGINESIEESVELNDLTEDSVVTLNILWSELYKNMHKAKADWLYNLTEWEGIFSEEERTELVKEFRRSQQAVSEKQAGRNDPCPCGSGKKYKKCCGK